MKIMDETGRILQDPDLEKGFLESDRILTAHHDAVPAVKEQWHHEVTAVYPNGGRDVVRVIDVPGREAQPAWEEYEDILRYRAYTLEELAAKQTEREKAEQEGARLPNLEKENRLLRQQVNALADQNSFLEDCIAEMAAIVYA